MKELIKNILYMLIGIILIILSIKLLSDIIITREECETNGGTFIDGKGINNECIYNNKR